jgi:hypothetical protein
LPDSSEPMRPGSAGTRPGVIGPSRR